MKKHLDYNALLPLFQEHFIYDPLSGLLRWRTASRTRSYFAHAIGDVAGALAGPRRDYLQVHLAGTKFRVSRICWVLHYGSIDPALEIDHININSLDNSIANMRLSNSKQQKGNRRLQWNNKSGHRGVRRDKHGSWVARLAGKHLGCFVTYEAAVACFEVAALERYAEFYSTAKRLA